MRLPTVSKDQTVLLEETKIKLLGLFHFMFVVAIFEIKS